MSYRDKIHGPAADEEVEQDVRAELEVDPGIATGRFVRVTVDGGVVRLTGSTDSYAQRWAITRAVGRVLGVRDVRDHLDVRPPEDVRRDDLAIEQAARRVLEWDARVPGGIEAQVTDGVLRLRGTVSRFPEREDAEEAVRNLVGVRDLVNEIRVARAPAPQPADLAQRVEDALRRRFGLATGDVSVGAAEGVVTLTGLAPTFATLDDIERAVRSIPGVTRIDNRLLVA